MAHITSIRFWSDPGFTEGCIEIPGLNYVLPTASYAPLSMDGWRPAKNALFDKIKIEESFPNLINMSFLEAVFTFEDESEMTFYGWIDNVSILFDDTDHPVTVIDWHIDYWMTYRRNAQFKYGLVRRRSFDGDSTRPPQNPPYVFKEAKRVESLVPDIDNITGKDLLWVMLNVIRTNSDNATERRLVAIPIHLGIGECYVRKGVTVTTTTWKNIVLGLFDEVYGIPPSEIVSVYVSPIAPMSFTGTGTQQDPIAIPSGSSWSVMSKTFENVTDGQTACWLVWHDTYDPATYTWMYSLSQEVKTNDISTYTITDFKGNVVGALPFGFPCQTYTVRIVNTSSAGYLQFRFDGWIGGTEGLTFNIVLPSLDLSSNSWSSYVYSGQKQYDAESHRLANQHALIQGGISTIAGTASGATTGGLMGSLGGPLGTIGGALVGGAGELLGGALTAGLSYAENIRYTDKLLGAMSEYHADQLDNMLIYGDSLDWIWNGRVPSMVELSIDYYSNSQFNHEIAELGYKVAEPTFVCQPLINAGGPLQIENLIVGGNIPARAKDYIRDRFRRGVRLI